MTHSFTAYKAYKHTNVLLNPTPPLQRVCISTESLFTQRHDDNNNIMSCNAYMYKHTDSVQDWCIVSTLMFGQRTRAKSQVCTGQHIYGFSTSVDTRHNKEATRLHGACTSMASMEDKLTTGL